MSHILLVEDDVEIAESVLLFLEAQSYKATHLTTGEFVVETVKKDQPDLVLLDLMLPIKNGTECCKDIRAFSDVPIIMLTAKVEEIDRLVGLEAGADDYVCKPFSAMELMLRIKAILKRTNRNTVTNNFNLDVETLKVRYLKNVIELTYLEFNLFNLLYQSPERIYSRAQILDLAYPDMRDISDRTVDAHVKNIRNKIKSLGISDVVVESVYGAGYRYIAPIN
ncbi:response regulator [Colwellia psychrerythraea]|uniref:Two component transcriptional regulator, winged helix family n=1 Tax=Colwellia psychrerythraea TaxID=28229 RepID=A0A099KN95_COLPS|nr:response regulator [Colwellia psychrerythraea]KGJ91685.1 two component transcriptional regulator, winged helix family [Colwellia psychrerythraea]